MRIIASSKFILPKAEPELALNQIFYLVKMLFVQVLINRNIIMTDNMILKEQIDNRIKVFWEQQEKFRNHPLQTEQPNSKTLNLSVLAKNNLQEAVNISKNVDLDAVRKMVDYLPEMNELKEDIQKVLERGNKIYISGCGASGRLAVAIEYLWNYTVSEDQKGNVIGFLGGGDNAMIKSIEGFEDFKDYGIKQLKLVGFKDGDLLIAASASGRISIRSGYSRICSRYFSKTLVCSL